MAVTFDEIVAMTADLPMVGVGTSYGTPAVQVKGKSFCRMWDDSRYVKAGIDDTEVLVVMGELEVKSELMEVHGPVVFETDHYAGHGAYLVRLADVDPDDLADWLEEAYRLRAPKTALNQLDERCD
ncbi:MAG: MmcQ/YjbR family DNA-binding protein [Actinomycetota bacterium]